MMRYALRATHDALRFMLYALRSMPDARGIRRHASCVQRLASGVLRYASCIMLVAGVVGCREDQPASSPTALPSQVVEGFVLHESSSGERLYSLEAETAYVFEAEERIDVSGPRVRFYDEEGLVHATLVADRGLILSRTNDLVALGNVLVETADSTKLTTDSLCWNNSTRIVRTDAHVEIETPNGRIAGKGLISDAALSRIEILSEVEGTSDYEFGTSPDSQ